MKVRASVKKRSADCKIVGLIINLVKRVKEIYGKNRWCRFALK